MKRLLPVVLLALAFTVPASAQVEMVPSSLGKALADTLYLEKTGGTLTGPVTFTGVAAGIRTVTATTTATANDFTILADATAAAVTVNLPAAGTVTGQIYAVKKIDASVNVVTVDPSGTEVIDGAATASISAAQGAILFQSNGTAWFRLVL